jgi:copper resistance protein B
VHVLVGRAISPWWDVVAGVRQDAGEARPQTWAAIGLQGLAPMWFDIEATAYVGGSGRTGFRLEADYELLVTNRAILQPTLEIDVFGKADPQRGVGAGLSTVEGGLRLRYEFRRELAPYIGVTWNRKAFGTADLARRAGERTSETRLVVGLRAWM